MQKKRKVEPLNVRRVPIVVRRKLKKWGRFAEVRCRKQKSLTGIDADSII